MPSLLMERLIWKRWNLNLHHSQQQPQNTLKHSDSPLSWSPPMPRAFKMNFDGAAKGNPGPAGFGVIFRNHEGTTAHIYFGSLGCDSNNAAELEGLWQGICIAESENFFPLEVEGDS